MPSVIFAMFFPKALWDETIASREAVQELFLKRFPRKTLLTKQEVEIETLRERIHDPLETLQFSMLERWNSGNQGESAQKALKELDRMATAVYPILRVGRVAINQQSAYWETGPLATPESLELLRSQIPEELIHLLDRALEGDRELRALAATSTGAALAS